MKHESWMSWLSGRARATRLQVAPLLVALVLAPSSAWAGVKLSGSWPATEKPVSLTVANKSRAAAIRALADAAGWSLVLDGVSGDSIELQVKEQAPAKVLELLLAEGDFAAQRDGELVSIRRLAAPETSSGNDALPGLLPVPRNTSPASPPVTPEPPSPPASKGDSGESDRASGARAEDRTVFGSSATLEKGETVHDFVVMGGAAVVEGTVTGDLVVLGGSVEVKKGAHVMGDTVAIGGAIEIEEGATLDGETTTLGGSIERPDADAAPKSNSARRERRAKARHAEKHSGAHEDADDDHESWSLGGAVRGFGSRLASTAVLWLVGAMLLAFASGRMETLQLETVARPLRSIGVGMIASVVAVLAAVILVVTLIGIPVALFGVLGTFAAGYVGACAVLGALGNVLVRHRTDNVYVHLAVGCLIFLIVGALPFVGGLATFVVVMMGFGVFVATRGAGLFNARRPNAPPPYSNAEAL